MGFNSGFKGLIRVKGKQFKMPTAKKCQLASRRRL